MVVMVVMCCCIFARACPCRHSSHMLVVLFETVVTGFGRLCCLVCFFCQRSGVVLFSFGFGHRFFVLSSLVWSGFCLGSGGCCRFFVVLLLFAVAAAVGVVFVVARGEGTELTSRSSLRADPKMQNSSSCFHAQDAHKNAVAQQRARFGSRADISLPSRL